MQKYQIHIVSGNEYRITVIAADYDSARAYALDLDIEQMYETGEVETVVSGCEVLTDEEPAAIAGWVNQ